MERTPRDKNKIIDKGSYLLMELYDKKNNVNGLVKFDKEDYCKVKYYKWGLNGKYARSFYRFKGKLVSIAMHRLVMDTPDELEADHIYFNTLDNRKKMLRNVSHSENVFNKRWQAGVYIDKDCVFKKYYSKIYVNGCQINLGYFYTYKDALKKRQEAEKKYFPNII